MDMLSDPWRPSAWSQAAPTDLGQPVDEGVDSGLAAQTNPAINPQWTGSDGRFIWQAPPGCWYVRVEAEGYATTFSPVIGTSDGLTDLNIALQPWQYLYLPIVTTN